MNNLKAVWYRDNMKFINKMKMNKKRKNLAIY